MAQLGYRVMDTQIFNLNLSVYASSAYIVVCSLVGDGVQATLEAIRTRWNADEAELQKALKELGRWQVLECNKNLEGQSIYAPNPASLWRQPGDPR
ncbi:MAG: hypothetical protein LBJ64_01935 [Deltaproteobacteria bacterium]|jgi:hypothetical protein|nr:hypothetical protein [Deltaproteobacteria bacterium]